MKKTLTFLAAVIALCIVSACGGNNNAGNNNAGSDKNTGYATYKEALANNDFEAAHKIIAQAEADANVLDGDEFAEKYGFKHYERDIDEVKNEIFNAEANFLAIQGDEAANKRLIVLLNEEPMQGKARSEGQVLAEKKSASYANLDNLYNIDSGYSKYAAWCNKYNSRCLSILEIAVNLGNKDLAQLMVNAIKPDPEITTKPYPTDDYYRTVYAHYTTHSKDAAKAKYEEHFGKSAAVTPAK